MTDSNSNYSDLPQGWKLTKIGEVCTKPQYGYTTKAAQEGNIHLLRTTDITSGQINWNTVPFCLENPSYPEKYILKDGDIVISRAGSIGCSYLIKNPKYSVFASYLIRFQCKEIIDQKFFKLFLKSPLYWQSISEKKLGIAVLNINATKLQDIDIPLPPLPEQHRIVEKIEELFSELDNGVASLKKALEQLKTYRQAVLKWAFEGKLTEKWRNTHQDSLEDADTLLEQIKAERKRHYQQQLEDWKQALKEWENNGKETKKPTAPRKQEYYSPLKQEETNKLWKIPDKWTWEKVGNICQSIVPNRDKPKSFSGNIPWITTPDIDSDLITLKLLPNHLGLNINEVELYNARVIPKNSVIMTCVGSFGIVCINTISCVINQQLHAFMTHSYINNKYLAYALKIQQSWMEKKSTSTTVVYLNKTNSNSVPIPLCSLQEQTKIVQEIESRLSICDQLEATLTENLDKAEALRQSILKRAFEGKLVL